MLFVICAVAFGIGAGGTALLEKGISLPKRRDKFERYFKKMTKNNSVLVVEDNGLYRLPTCEDLKHQKFSSPKDAVEGYWRHQYVQKRRAKEQDALGATVISVSDYNRAKEEGVL